MDLTVSVLNVINAVYFPRVQKNPEVFIARTYQENRNAYFFIFFKNERFSLSFFGDKPDMSGQHLTA